MDDHVVDLSALIDDPGQLRRQLTDRGVFSFAAYRSGLFPASDLPAEERSRTGMGMAWLRDNAHVAMALLEDGRTAEAAHVGSAMLSVLRANRNVSRGEAPGHLPVRVDGDTLANDTEPRVQYDSTGYALWLISRLARDGHLALDADDLSVLSETVDYLVRVQYWRTADDGHWEEERRLHASSIGTVVAGLRSTAALFDDHDHSPSSDISTAIRVGTSSLHALLGAGLTERPTDPAHDPRPPTQPLVPTAVDIPAGTREFLDGFDTAPRQLDAALLFLVEPLGVLTGVDATTLVTDIQDNLLGEHGVARYPGDTYWGPRFPDIMDIEERTRAAEGRTEQRNLTAAGVAFSGTEAQWTLFDPILSSFWGARYLDSGDAQDLERHHRHLRRSLEQLAAIGPGRRGLPESYYLEFDDHDRTNRWTGNAHVPLLWSHANLLRALRTLERTDRMRRGR